MSQVIFNATDEALLANLRFYLDDDPGQTMDEPTVIQRWKDVFNSFVDDYGPNEFVARVIMWVLVLEADDAGQIHFDIGKLLKRTRVKSKKQLQDGLLKLEKRGWICRSSGDEGGLEPRLVDRAKRLYMRLAHDAGCSVYFDDEIGTYSATKDQSATIRQTSIGLAEPRRTFETRTFFVRLDKTS